jgi:Mycolic acid cyclopropane synthetase
MVATWRARGLVGCARMLRAAMGMSLPLVVCGRRTAGSVGAYFDLITDDGRLFYGGSLHLGYFPRGDESLGEALDAHTDLVAELARVKAAAHVLDVGCCIAAPALRIARRYGCQVTGVNISREQVRQGRELIAAERLSDRVDIQRGDARALEFSDESFDAIVCMEAAGDIASPRPTRASSWGSSSGCCALAGTSGSPTSRCGPAPRPRRIGHCARCSTTRATSW